MQQSLIILKPDAVARGLVGEVTSRFEKKGFKLVWAKMTMLSTEVLTEHYGHLADKPFFPSILEYMQAAPVMLQIREGEGGIDIIRQLIWITDPAKAAQWTIRGDYSINISCNIIHASETEEEAKEEIARFFDASDVQSYERADQNFLYGR